MTPKQEAFVREYLVDLNATQAAVRAGYDWPSDARGFYVYFLMDGDEIFYVGKGKGKRIGTHRRERMKASATNQVKAARIRTAIERGVFSERVFASNLAESEALRIERGLIGTMKSQGLTNISSGSVHPLESQIARIDANLDNFRPFDEWCAIAPDYARRFAEERYGSMRAFYDWMRERFTELRNGCEAQLREAHGHG